MRSPHLRLTFAAFAVAVLHIPERAAAADFYAGKRLSILVNYDVGGSNDIEARLIARHIGLHIPGNPPVIVQNMSGAGGMVGARWLGEKAPRDGTVAEFITAAPQRYALSPERYKIDLRTYQYVAYMPNGRIHFVRTSLAPGIKTGIDVVKAEGVVAGGLSAESPKDLAMRLVLDMLGAKYRYVTGYNSAMRALLAFERNEINLWSDSASFWLSQIEPLAKKGEVVPICYDPYLLDGKYVVPRQLRTMQLTSCPDLLRSTKGGMPTGEKAEAYQALLAFSGVMYRTFLFPPEVPSEAVTILRKAMLALNDDKAYQEEATKLIGEAPEYISSPDINAQAARLMTLPPNIKKFLSDYAQRSKP